MVDRYRIFVLMIVFGALSRPVAAAPDAAPLPSYMLMADEAITRDRTEADIVIFGNDSKKVGEKLKELGLAFPNAVAVPRGSRFVMVISDYTDQAFAGMSAERVGPKYIVELGRDEEQEGAGRGDAVPNGKKKSRLLLIACPPAREIKAWAIKTADGKQHEVKGTELR